MYVERLHLITINIMYNNLTFVSVQSKSSPVWVLVKTHSFSPGVNSHEKVIPVVTSKIR